MEKLRKLIEEHKKIVLPIFPKDDMFAEWVEKLIEIDSYYIGLAISILNKGKVSIQYEHIENFKNNLIEYKSLNEDVEIFIKCEKYLKSLEEITIEIKNIYY